jgi:hypothetical protein
MKAGGKQSQMQALIFDGLHGVVSQKIKLFTI